MVEGLLSTGPTPSSFTIVEIGHDNAYPPWALSLYN